MKVDIIVVVVDGVLAIEVITGRAEIVASVVHISIVRQQCQTKLIMSVDEGLPMCPGYGGDGFFDTRAAAQWWRRGDRWGTRPRVRGRVGGRWCCGHCRGLECHSKTLARRCGRRRGSRRRTVGCDAGHLEFILQLVVHHVVHGILHLGKHPLLLALWNAAKTDSWGFEKERKGHKMFDVFSLYANETVHRVL